MRRRCNGGAARIGGRGCAIRCCSSTPSTRDEDGAFAITAKHIGRPLLFGRLCERFGIADDNAAELSAGHATLAFVRPPPVLPYRHHPVNTTYSRNSPADITYRQNENCCAKLARSRLLILGIESLQFADCAIARTSHALRRRKGDSL
jgi:hypothetical protein